MLSFFLSNKLPSYWTEASDVEDLAGSVIFDPETGFGGNGTGEGGCVVDGPFANLTLRIKEDLSASEYCLTRNLNHCMFKSAAQSNVDSCLAMDTFEKARQCLEGMPHGAGHGGVGALVCQPSDTGDFSFVFDEFRADK